MQRTQQRNVETIKKFILNDFVQNKFFSEFGSSMKEYLLIDIPKNYEEYFQKSKCVIWRNVTINIQKLLSAVFKRKEKSECLGHEERESALANYSTWDCYI